MRSESTTLIANWRRRVPAGSIFNSSAGSPVHRGSSFSPCRRLLLVCGVALLYFGAAVSSTAQLRSSDNAKANELAPVPEPPEIPERLRSGQRIDPDVKISTKQRGDDTVTEYRVDGRVRAVKITPQIGPPYYLYDLDGDGRLERRSDQFDPNLVIPHWVIFRW